jgi:hypothetical protein
MPTTDCEPSRWVNQHYQMWDSIEMVALYRGARPSRMFFSALAPTQTMHREEQDVLRDTPHPARRQGPLHICYCSGTAAITNMQEKPLQAARCPKQLRQLLLSDRQEHLATLLAAPEVLLVV